MLSSPLLESALWGRCGLEQNLTVLRANEHVGRRCPKRRQQQPQLLCIPGLAILHNLAHYVFLSKPPLAWHGVSVYPSIHPSTHTSLHLYIFTYIHTYMHACMHACMHAYTHFHIYIYMYVYVSIYVYTYPQQELISPFPDSGDQPRQADSILFWSPSRRTQTTRPWPLVGA